MKKRALSLVLALAMCLGLCATALAEEGAPQTEIHVSTADDLVNTLARTGLKDTKVILDAEEYVLKTPIVIESADNVTVDGGGRAKIVSDPSVDLYEIFSISGSVITFNGIAMGFTNSEKAGYVLDVHWSQVTVTNCDIFGGTRNIMMDGGTLIAENTTIRDSRLEPLTDYQAPATLTNCTFANNGRDVSREMLDLTSLRIRQTKISFTGCAFVNNPPPSIMETTNHPENLELVTFENCTYFGNGWGGDNVSAAPAVPTFGPAMSTGKPDPAPTDSTPVPAKPTSAKVLVNGQEVAFDAYDIGGANYFKLRDLAYVLNGTEKQFEVYWDAEHNYISLTAGLPYTPVGGEMTAQGGGEQTAVPTVSDVFKHGSKLSLTAYNINGANYFKLRDIGVVFDFGVGWDADTKTITIDTSVGYTA